MKKYVVIGNPIDHSLSPQLHNYWIKKNNINALYEKKKLNFTEIKDFIIDIKQKKIDGANVTVPFKKEVIPYIEKLTVEAKDTQSVNTIYLENNQIVGHNTDVFGFESSIKEIKFDLKNKKILILGAGGVVPSIVYSLNKMKVSKILIMNRTKKKGEDLKKLFNDLEIIEWGIVPEFDMIINATSVGLNQNDNLELNFSNIKNEKFFYDVIYNPVETNFLKTGKDLGNQVLNGKMMFIYQAAASFNLWHKINPSVNKEVIELLNR
jgi:shikimate dehydrogenase